MTALRALICVLALALAPGAANADTARIAVASNFTSAAKALADEYAALSGHAITPSYGATGALYLQISQGAPYAAFLAADQARPALLLQDDRAVPGSGFTYAIGELALFSRDAAAVLGPDYLKQAPFERIAIADPATAPYGLAAMQTLQSLGLDAVLAPRIVRGKNIGQTFQFIWSGAAEAGFVARSQIADAGAGAHWTVPSSLHEPIAQDAVLLDASSVAARGFLAYLRSPAGRATISRHGYATPE